jgi:hypothetical protein
MPVDWPIHFHYDSRSLDSSIYLISLAECCRNGEEPQIRPFLLLTEFGYPPGADLSSLFVVIDYPCLHTFSWIGKRLGPSHASFESKLEDHHNILFRPHLLWSMREGRGPDTRGARRDPSGRKRGPDYLLGHNVIQSLFEYAFDSNELAP